MRHLTATLIFSLTLTACTPHDKASAPLGPHTIVQAIIDEQIIPDHAAFAEAATLQKSAITALCTAPDEATLQKARVQFTNVVLAWSRIEWISFGPARENNRRETLFFWPDSRGRGIKQAEALAGAQDPSQFNDATFADKSVAVKGLLALEYILFGDGAQVLLSEGAPRCAYARSVTSVIASTALDLKTSWQGQSGYREVMLEAGPDNPAFKNHNEALQKLLTAASEQVQIARDLKLAPILREKNEVPVPIQPPFSDSGLSMAAITANIDSASAVFLDHAALLLPDESAHYTNSLAFEINTINNVLNELNQPSLTIDMIATSEPLRSRLEYLLFPLGGAYNLMSQSIPAALGLITGFNSLDGD